VRHEVEVARVLARHGEAAPAAGLEPGDLVVELLFLGFIGVGEDRAADLVELFGHVQAGGGERLPEGIALAVDVEITQRDEVVVPPVHALGPIRHPARDALQLGDPVGGIASVVHVERHEDERRVRRPEADRVGRTRKLPLQRVLSQIVRPFRRNDQLAGQSRRLHAARVVQKGHPLGVARASNRHIRHEEGPTPAERLEQMPKRGEIARDLLDPDHVEARHDLRDRLEAAQVALGMVVSRRGPLLGQRSERADVPRRDEQVLVEVLGRDLFVQRGAEVVEILANARGRLVENRISGHALSPRAQST
jgi:hypothetical protein